MATASLAGNGQQKTVEQLLCSSELPDGLHGQLTFNVDLNSFLSITTFLGNALIVIALHKESSLHPPSKLLLRCLATTNLCVVLISLPYFSAIWLQLAIIACYLPYGVVTALAPNSGQISSVYYAWRYQSL